MAVKKFTKHAQRVLNHNENVVHCSEAKIIFTEEFAQKVCDALKAGEDPFKVFEDNGLSIRVLGKSRINGTIGLWKSKYELTDLPRRKAAPKEKKHVETAQERKQRNFEAAIKACDELINNPSALGLEVGADNDTIHFAAIKNIYDSKMPVIVKDLCEHYGYPYSQYYGYLRSLKPKEEFVNILNPHSKK
jgi:hypothetical protein